MREILPGTRFARLTVLREGRGWYGRRSQAQRRRTVVCRCDCGNVREVILNNLLNGGTKSCGCLRVEQLRRGSSRA